MPISLRSLLLVILMVMICWISHQLPLTKTILLGIKMTDLAVPLVKDSQTVLSALHALQDTLVQLLALPACLVLLVIGPQYLDKQHAQIALLVRTRLRLA